jgi:hypothetical protein
MSLAFIVMAHHQPNHLARLVRALNQENCRFFIHIDAKVPIEPFQTLISPVHNVVFVSRRVRVEWGKFSIVEGILNSLEAAVASGIEFKYYTLLSGSDYPIKHKTAIYSFFQKAAGQHIRIDRKLTREPGDKFRHFLKKLPQGSYFGNMMPFHGSMHWSLSAECIHFILEFVRNNPGYAEVNRQVFAPDEVFFHTILKHSQFADAITQDFSNGVYRDHIHHANHFIDWAGLRRRKRLILDERDVDDLVASPALFARKFDERKSSKLLDLLDRQVHSPV